MQTTNILSASLHYREGNSDKVYQAAVEPKDDGYIVTFAYGRRGNTLATGIKNDTPVPGRSRPHAGYGLQRGHGKNSVARPQ